jgi:glucan phosphoethanolaminetransferase (alkaline phosphatase superfamily)
MAQESHTKETRAATRAWVALVLLNLFLLSPIASNEVLVRLSSGEHDKLLLFNAPASILWLLAMHAIVRRPLWLHLCLFPFYFLVGCDLYLVIEYQTRLSSSSLSVILDNWENAGDYVRTHEKAMGIPFVVWAGAYVAGVLQLRGMTVDWRQRLRVLPFAGLALLYSAVGIRQMRALHAVGTGLLDVVSHDRSSPLGVIPQMAIAYSVYRDTIVHERAAQGFHFGARRDGDPSERRVVVLVQGESSRYDHWGLYGYARDTTPLLGARGDLVVFRDVTCQAPLTKLSVPLIITRGDIDHVDDFAREKSIVTAYREAGYRTAWFSTQQRDQWTGAINRYTNEADQQRFFERRLDGVLVDQLAETLRELPGESLFVVLHTQGSHFAYNDRYPADFRRFPESGVGEREALVNAYDNSILYTDHVLTSVITLLEQQGLPAAVLYVSDHGENLKDDEHNLVGHFFGNEWDVPVPMVLWMSPPWVAADPERARTVREHTKLRLSTTLGFYTLADLGHVVIDGDDGFALRSLLRSTYAERPRRYLAPSQTIIDFDERYPDHHARAIAAH